jgi:long-chain acyl-CoA synthetase
LGDRVSAPRSIPDLVRAHAAARPEQQALVDPSGRGRFSWAQLDAAVSAAASALRAAGCADADRVLLRLRTGADLVVLYLGALRAGLVAVPVNPAYTASEVDHVRADCAPALELDDSAARELLASAGPVADPRLDRTGDDLAVLLYTSGTSGRPRGAMLSSRALLANLDQVAALDPPLLSPADTVLVPLPLSHVYGLNAGLGNALRAGARTILYDRFDADETLAAMAAERVSVVVGVPTQYAGWLRRAGFAAGFGGVRVAISGSATLALGLVVGYRAAGITLHDGYGLTEAAPVVTLGLDGRANTVGQPLPGVELELRDGSEPVEPGDPGRIHIRGANLFSGYWPDGAGGPDADGWFATGDLGVLDDDGDLRLVGRSAELVIVNGFNVYPAEVEAVLAAERGVAEVAVVGMPDPATGEAVHAYVVPAPGARLDPDALRSAAARSLARFKLPAVIDVVTELPHTVTGKVMKWQLGRGEGS